MGDWSLHRHIATVGILGNAIYDRAYCAHCRKPWPCPVAQKKKDYEASAMTQLAPISDMAERGTFVEAMRAGLLRIDQGA